MLLTVPLDLQSCLPFIEKQASTLFSGFSGEPFESLAAPAGAGPASARRHCRCAWRGSFLLFAPLSPLFGNVAAAPAEAPPAKAAMLTAAAGRDACEGAAEKPSQRYAPTAACGLRCVLQAGRVRCVRGPLSGELQPLRGSQQWAQR